jgi:GTP1/Obg family GTP-binding protein
MTATLQVTPEQAQQLILMLQSISAPASKPKKARTPKKAQNVSFEDFLYQQILPHFGAELSQEIVESLTDIRLHHPDFRKIRKFYHKVATIENRQLLKVLTAAYRIKYNRYSSDQYLSSLMSTIRYATICPHCGQIANNFVYRLIQDGYMN